MDDDVDKGRFVAIKLGLWNHEQCPELISFNTRDGDWTCRARHSGTDRQRYIRNRAESADIISYPHEIPPPDFLSPAGADLLLRTLLKTYSVYFGIKSDDEHPVLVMVAKVGCEQTGYGDTPAQALLDAAYNLLKALEGADPS